jgi:hypothetical protein
MANFVGKPLEISRMLGFCDLDDPSNLPAGLAALCRNSDFGLTSVVTRAGVNLNVNGTAAGIQGINKSPITGLMGLIYTPENASQTFFQLPILFDMAGLLQGEPVVGSGTAEAITSSLLTPPTRAHMIGTQAYNKAWVAFSDLIYPKSNPSSPTPGMGVLNLETFHYGDPTKAFDPYGMKPYGWTWLPNTPVIVGEVATPTRANVNGHNYECTTPGPTGGTEPTWPTGSGATVTDGTAVWTEHTPSFSNVYDCYPPYPTSTIAAGNGGSWPSDANGILEWLYFVYTYVTADGETDIQKALVALETPAVSSTSYVLACPTPAGLPSGFTGDLPTGWNLYIATASAGAEGLPPWQGFQKWNDSPLAFATNYTVSQIQNNGSPPTSNTAKIVGAGNCDTFEVLADGLSFSAGTGVSGSLYEVGIRYAAIMFVNRNYSVSGFTKASTVPVRIYSNGSTLVSPNLPLGPANTIARIVSFTELEFDENADINDLPTWITVGSSSHGSQTQTAGTTNPGQWRTIEMDGSLNSEWEFNNGQWRTIDSWGNPEKTLQPIYTQAMGFGLGPDATLTGIQFDLQWLNQPGGAPGILLSASLSYLGSQIGNTKQLNIPSHGQITDTLVGGNGDLWGASLTPTIINDPSFGVEFIIQQGAFNGSSHRLFIDYANITAYYSANESLSIPMARGTNAGPYFYNGNFNPGPDYFVFPQTTPSDGFNEAATVMGDNTTALGYFSYTDDYLIADNDVTDRLRVIWPYACVDFYYSETLDRMIQTGVPGFNGHWVSLAADPESYYVDSGFVPTQNANGERAICAREFRGQLYSFRERSGYVMQIASIDPDSGNPTWNVRKRWGKVGPCGPRAVDVCGKFMVFVHRSGIFKYDGNPNSEGGAPEPEKVSKELRYWWKRINWQAAQTIWCTIDEETHTVKVGVPIGDSQVPDLVIKLYYEEGWNLPIHFSTFSQKEISMDAARRYSIDDISAYIGLRIERNIPVPPAPFFIQGDAGIDVLDSAWYTSQFLYASSAPDGCVLAITPGIWHDGEGGPTGKLMGIDWQYETMSQGVMLSQCKFEGFSLNSRGNGKLYWCALQGRTMITDWTPDGSPEATTDLLITGEPIDLTENEHVGDTELVEAQFGERWRMHFSNAKIADAWGELKNCVLYAIPFSSGRPQGQQK